jgi:uncharacterized protein
MGLALLLVIPVVLATSVLSGIFGMGGGLILMGALALVLPVGAAMVLHGTTQLVANGYRAYELRRHIRWAVLPPFALGAGVALGGFAAAGVAVDRGTLYVILGATPLLLMAAPRLPVLTIEHSSSACLCGLVVTAMQLLAGVAGPLLDLFFLRGRLDRFEVVATKAMTQTLGHAIKIVYFGALLRGAGDLGWSTYAAVVVAAVVGTAAGTRLLAHLSDAHFRRYSARLVLVIALALLAQGAADLLGR